MNPGFLPILGRGAALPVARPLVPLSMGDGFFPRGVLVERDGFDTTAPLLCGPDLQSGAFVFSATAPFFFAADLCFAAFHFLCSLTGTDVTWEPRFPFGALSGCLQSTHSGRIFASVWFCPHAHNVILALILWHQMTGIGTETLGD